MATSNSTFSLIGLDHGDLKQSLKTYLKAQPQFKDYDFESSNINVLLDVLAYNTYKNAFYYNMAISEAFLDSAQLRPSVVSHAKDLNYLARSKRSSKAQVTVTFTATGESSPYIIQKGSPFTALVKNQSFTFTLPETLIVSSSNTTFEFTSNIYEGQYLKDVYVVSDTSEFPKYRITNKNVDTSSLTVAVYEDGSETADIYKVTDTLLDLDANSKIFFIQAVDDGYYEVLFGDDFFGKKPKIGSTIVLDYRIASGPAANGAKQFSCDFDPTGADELTGNIEVEVIENAADGLDIQDTESIRVYAPRHFAAQKRAVASDDYASLVLANFTGTVDDVNVYGGETVEPKQYGRVILAIKPSAGRIAPNFIKDEITAYLRKYVSLPTRVLIADPEYFYLQVTTTVSYDTAATNKTAAEIKGIVANAIESFSGDNLEKFDRDFRYSKFVNFIDESDTAITSNETSIKMIKRLMPKPFSYNTFNIKYNNQFHPGRRGYSGHPIISSSSFTYINEDGTYYPISYLRDNGEGVIEIYTNINSQEVILNEAAGSVDYTNGNVNLTKLNFAEYGDYLSIYAIPIKKDVIMNKANILFIETADTNITVTGTIN
jgi:hypothetical protein